MRRSVVFMVVGALLLTMVAGVASAATFVCDSDPCFGTNNDDMIGERDKQGASDDIRARDGDDQINARRAGNDRDVLRGQDGRDTLIADDGDSRDTLDGGPGRDSCRGDRGDTFRSCETIDRV